MDKITKDLTIARLKGFTEAPTSRNECIPGVNHKFVIIRGTGKHNGTAIWECMCCDKKIYSS